MSSAAISRPISDSTVRRSLWCKNYAVRTHNFITERVLCQAIICITRYDIEDGKLERWKVLVHLIIGSLGSRCNVDRIIRYSLAIEFCTILISLNAYRYVCIYLNQTTRVHRTYEHARVQEKNNRNKGSHTAHSYIHTYLSYCNKNSTGNT